MTHQDRLAALNAAILAVRPHGFLAESVLGPLQTLRDDLAAESPPAADKHAPAKPRHAQADATADTPTTK